MKWILTVLAVGVIFTNTARAEPCGVSCNGGWASGTTVEGAPEGKTYVVTNRHVVAVGGRQIKLDKTVYNARLVGTHPSCDLALLVVDASLPASKLAPADPKQNDSFQLQGYGVSSGGFDLIRKDVIEYCVGSKLATKMFISPGDSGSGLISKDNELIGVIWGCRGLGGGPGVGIPVSEVKTLIANPQPQPQPRPYVIPPQPQRRYRF